MLANGRLATIVIDATDFEATDPNNPFELRLAATLMGDSDFAGLQADIINGHLILICLSQLSDPDAMVRRWVTLALAKVRRRGVCVCVCVACPVLARDDSCPPSPFPL